MIDGKIVRRRDGKGGKISLPVSPLIKDKWEEIGKALFEKGMRSTPTRLCGESPEFGSGGESWQSEAQCGEAG